MSSLIVRAHALAEQLHAGQTRKASLVPGVSYMCHLGAVAAMVEEAGGSPEEIAAAWLHDTLEDTPCTEAELLKVMPAEVVSLVQECTEIGTSGPIKADWKTRKDAYIAHISHVSIGALRILAPDKFHSLQGLKQSVRVQGHEAYRQLVKSANDLTEQRRLTLWFNGQVLLAAQDRLAALEEQHGGLLLVGIDALLSEMEEIIQWLYNH